MDRVDRKLVEAESTVEGSGVLKSFVPLIFVSGNMLIFNASLKNLLQTLCHCTTSLAGKAFKFGRGFRGLRAQLSTCAPVQRRRVLPEAAGKVRARSVVRN